MNEMFKRFEFVFSREDLDRFCVKDEELYIDVHGMTCSVAQRFLKNTLALLKGGMNIYIIHGYNSGCALKEMLRNTPLSHREYQVQHVNWNPGMSRLVIA